MQTYGVEESTLLEKEVIPAIQKCLARAVMARGFSDFRSPFVKERKPCHSEGGRELLGLFGQCGAPCKALSIDFIIGDSIAL